MVERVVELVEREADLGRVGLDRRLAEVVARAPAPASASCSTSRRRSWRSCVSRSTTARTTPSAEAVAHAVDELRRSRRWPSCRDTCTTAQAVGRAHASRPVRCSRRARCSLYMLSSCRCISNRAAQHVCGVRAVPAALPDVPRHRRGGALATRADRRHARSRVAWRPDRRRLRRDHRDLRAVPRVRAGLPERRAVRPPDRGHAAATRASSARSRRAGSGSAFSMLPRHGRCSPGRRRWRSRSDCGWSPRRLGLSPGCRCAAGRRSTPTGADVWLFTGCVMDAWHARHAPSDGRGARRAGRRPTPSLAHRGACCGALHTHAGLHDEAVELARRVMASMPGDGADPRQLRRLRGGAQGLRPSARHRRRASFRGTRARRPRVDRPPSRRAARGCGARRRR